MRSLARVGLRGAGAPSIGARGIHLPPVLSGFNPAFTLLPTPFQTLLPSYTPAPTPTIYVDTVSGSDANSGLTSALPKATFGAAVTLAGSQGPGACIGVRCGSTIVGPIFIDGISGASGNPIWVKPYGTGSAPIFSWTSDAGFNLYNDGSSTYFRDGSSYWTFDGGTQNGLKFTGARESGVVCSGHDTGRAAGGHFEFYNCEFSDLGLGISLDDPVGHSTVQRCYFHDGHMVVNTPTNINANDDYGANGIRIGGGTGNLISFNFAERLKADSYDYTTDGGFLEFYSTSATSPIGGCEIAYNYVKDTMGFSEGGGDGVQSGGVYECNISNMLIHHNLMVNVEKFFTFHKSGAFGATFAGCKFHHNTYVQTAAHISGGNYAYGGSYDGEVTTAEWEFYSNLFFLNQRATTQDFLAMWDIGMDQTTGQVAGWHHDNVYFIPSYTGPTSYTITGGQAGMHMWTNWAEGINASEARYLMTDPCFTNLASGDYSPAAGSNAVGFGAI